MNHIRMGLLLTALFMAVAPVAVAATTWYVNGVNGNDSNNCKSPTAACGTISHAISFASSGDTVMVAATTYTENLTIGTSLNVIGAAATTTIIDGNHAGRVVTISSADVQITLSNITIRNGGVNGFGGGIYNIGMLTINNSTVSGNTSFHPASSCGGGIYNSGQLTINVSTISGNRAMGDKGNAYGGGICASGSVTINNSTLSGNSAFCGNILQPCSSDGGGAIYNGGILVVNNSTLSGNSATENWQNFVPLGGGIYNNSSGEVHFQNSILANNRVIETGHHQVNEPSNCYGSATSNGYNLSDDGTCTFHNSGDRNNTNPMLGPLQNNGGPTQTMALPSGSPAIDAGNPSGCTDGQGHLLKTDQRGYPRPDSEDKTGCDMGAYERQSD